MKRERIKILIVEDNAGDARLIQELLREAVSFQFDCTHVTRLSEVRPFSSKNASADETMFDAILLDIGLPDSQGLGTLTSLREIIPTAPIVLLTGLEDEMLALESIRNGAQDYLIKGLVDSRSLVQAVRYAIERKQTETELQESQQTLQTLMSNLPGMAYRCLNDDERTLLFSSAGCLALTGFAASELTGYQRLVHPDDRWMVQANVQISAQAKRPFELTYRIITRTGREKWVWEHGRLVSHHAHQDGVLEGFVTDVTDQVRATESLSASEQRIHAVITNSVDGLLVLDQQGVVLYANPAAEKMLQLPGKTLLGYEFGLPIVADDRAELDIKDSQGHILTVEMRVAKMGWNGQPAYLTALRDITQRKKVETAVRASEERLRAVVETASDAIVMLDAMHHVVFWNPAAEVMFGYLSAEIMGQPLQMIIQDAGHTVQLQGILADPDYYHIARPVEMIGCRQDGSQFPVSLSLSKWHVANERFATVILRDISELQQAEQEREKLLAQIQEQAQQMRQIVNTVPDGVVLLAADYRILLVNPPAQEFLAALTEVKLGDVLQSLGERPLPDLLVPPPKGLWHEIGTGHLLFNVVARPIEYGPTHQGWVLVLHDVTQEREIQERAQEHDRLAAVGQLAAGIAHDFNNILAVISLYTQLSLRTPNLPASFVNRLKTIDSQAMRATNLIQQVLDFSRQAMIDRQPLPLLPFLKELVKLLQRTLPENIHIQLVHLDGDHIVHADPTRIQQAIMNLALNARDAMPEGGNLTVELHDRHFVEWEKLPLPEMSVGDWVHIIVSDTGTGISPEILPHVYEPFFTTKTPDRGSGLGLSQVYGIIKQHEGHIDVVSIPGEGTTFHIYIPAMPVIQTTQPIANKTKLQLGHGETLLVVEDNEIVREAIVESLRTLNYRVLEAADGRAALVVFDEHGNDIRLLISDVVMPEMGGVALLRTLRQRQIMIPVVLLTGHSLHDELASLRDQGVVDWLLKPPELAQLARVIATGLKSVSSNL